MVAVVQGSPVVFPPEFSEAVDPIGVEAHLKQGANGANPLIPERRA